MKNQFQHVTAWVFDLDNTLYPPQFRLFDQIEVRMTAYVMRALGVAQSEADRLRTLYWELYGTTLAGLMHEHGLDPVPYMADVHDISFAPLTPDPALRAAIGALPGRRIVFTNGSAPYAEKVLLACGLSLHNTLYLLRRQPVALHNAIDLCGLITVHHTDPIHIRRPRA